MTDQLRQAATLALEALESGLAFDNHSDVLQNLRTALAMHQVSEFAQAQEQAEPVATFQDGVLEGQMREREYWVKQQAEPTCPECKAAVLYECVACSSNNYPPQQQAEPVAMRMPKVGDKVICLEDESLGTVESLTAGGSPDITFDDGSRGTYLLREFAELFGYVAAPQRPWVGLTDEEIHRTTILLGFNPEWKTEIGMAHAVVRNLEAKLKERNT